MSVVPNLLCSRSEKYFGCRHSLLSDTIETNHDERWLVRPPTRVTSLILNRVLTIQNFLLGCLLPFLLARYDFFSSVSHTFFPSPSTRIWVSFKIGKVENQKAWQNTETSQLLRTDLKSKFIVVDPI